MYNLFIDDDENRIPNKLSWIQLPPYEWVIVRSYDAFVQYITKHGCPNCVSFDHDLGKLAYREFHRAWESDEKVINYDNIKEKTGYDAAQWLCEYCHKNGINFPEYYVHTLNPIGFENITKYIENYKGTNDY